MKGEVTGRGHNGGDHSEWREKNRGPRLKERISGTWWGRASGDCGVGLLTLFGQGKTDLTRRRGRKK